MLFSNLNLLYSFHCLIHLNPLLFFSSLCNSFPFFLPFFIHSSHSSQIYCLSSPIPVVIPYFIRYLQFPVSFVHHVPIPSFLFLFFFRPLCSLLFLVRHQLLFLFWSLPSHTLALVHSFIWFPCSWFYSLPYYCFRLCPQFIPVPALLYSPVTLVLVSSFSYFSSCSCPLLNSLNAGSLLFLMAVSIHAPASSLLLHPFHLSIPDIVSFFTYFSSCIYPLILVVFSSLLLIRFMSPLHPLFRHPFHLLFHRPPHHRLHQPSCLAPISIARHSGKHNTPSKSPE